MNRRGFLAGILAAGFAPAAIGSGVLMPVRQIVVPEVLYEDSPLRPGMLGWSFNDTIWVELPSTIQFSKVSDPNVWPEHASGKYGDVLIFRRWLPYGSGVRFVDQVIPMRPPR
jgi:hypothetical protein